MNVKEVADIVDTEGLEYAILNLDEDEITSPKLKKLWIMTKKNIDKIIEILEPSEYEFEEDSLNDED